MGIACYHEGLVRWAEAAPLSMDLDQLKTFLEIVRLKSFSKAAETCYRTQPAISAQVRQLEQELNASLFDRLGTRIALTPAGRIFAEYAERILDLRKQAKDAIVVDSTELTLEQSANKILGLIRIHAHRLSSKIKI